MRGDLSDAERRTLGRLCAIPFHREPSSQIALGVLQRIPTRSLYRPPGCRFPCRATGNRVRLAGNEEGCPLGVVAELGELEIPNDAMQASHDSAHATPAICPCVEEPA